MLDFNTAVGLWGGNQAALARRLQCHRSNLAPYRQRGEFSEEYAARIAVAVLGDMSEMGYNVTLRSHTDGHWRATFHADVPFSIQPDEASAIVYAAELCLSRREHSANLTRLPPRA